MNEGVSNVWVEGDGAEGFGDVGCAVEAVKADGEVAQGGHQVGSVAGADLRLVFLIGDVSDPVEPVLYSAVAANVGEKLFRGCFVGGQ